MKSRVNSRIDNVRRKTRSSNSLLTKKQGRFSCSRNEALGYCMFHSIYIGEKTYNYKKCSDCKRFIALIN